MFGRDFLCAEKNLFGKNCATLETPCVAPPALMVFGAEASAESSQAQGMPENLYFRG
jgi:hypothetical protein